MPWRLLSLTPALDGRTPHGPSDPFRRDWLSEADPGVPVTPPSKEMNAWSVGVLDEMRGVGR